MYPHDPTIVGTLAVSGFSGLAFGFGIGVLIFAGLSLITIARILRKRRALDKS